MLAQIVFTRSRDVSKQLHFLCLVETSKSQLSSRSFFICFFMFYVSYIFYKFLRISYVYYQTKSYCVEKLVVYYVTTSFFICKYRKKIHIKYIPLKEEKIHVSLYLCIFVSLYPCIFVSLYLCILLILYS